MPQVVPHRAPAHLHTARVTRAYRSTVQPRHAKPPIDGRRRVHAPCLVPPPSQVVPHRAAAHPPGRAPAAPQPVWLGAGAQARAARHGRRRRRLGRRRQERRGAQPGAHPPSLPEVFSALQVLCPAFAGRSPPPPGHACDVPRRTAPWASSRTPTRPPCLPRAPRPAADPPAPPPRRGAA